MKDSTRKYLNGKRNAWLSKIEAIESGNQKAISARLYQIAQDQFIGDPTSHRVCVNCADESFPARSKAGWDIYEEEDNGNLVGYWICLDCGHIQRMIGTRGDMPADLTDDQIGAISALIGRNRNSVDPKYIAGYDAKIAAMSAERERQAALMAEYNRLAEQGYTDSQIKSFMGF